MSQFRVPPVEAVLFANKLRLFGRLLRAPATVIAVVQSRGWAGMAGRACAGTRSAAGHDSIQAGSLPAPASQPRAWERFAREHPQSWKNIVSSFLKISAEDPVRVGEVFGLFCGDIESESSDEECMCADCGASFKTHAARQSHMARVHNFRNPLRRFVCSPICPVCGNDYHCRARCLVHVQRGSKACKAAILAGEVAVPSVATQHWADMEEQHRRVECRQLGVSDLSGPPCLPAGE